MDSTQYAVSHELLDAPVELPQAKAKALARLPGASLMTRTMRGMRGIRGQRSAPTEWMPVDGEPTASGALAPTDLPRLYQACFNGKDLAGLVALYEVDAVLITNVDGESVMGEALKAKLGSELNEDVSMDVSTVLLGRNGDLALLASRWTAKHEKTGKIAASGQSTDVCRRAADGLWRYAIDNPYGMALESPDDDRD